MCHDKKDMTVGEFKVHIQIRKRKYLSIVTTLDMNFLKNRCVSLPSYKEATHLPTKIIRGPVSSRRVASRKEPKKPCRHAQHSTPSHKFHERHSNPRRRVATSN